MLRRIPFYSPFLLFILFSGCELGKKENSASSLAVVRGINANLAPASTTTPQPVATLSSGGALAGLDSSTWIDPQFGKILTQGGGHSNPNIPIQDKKDLKLRIIFLQDSSGNKTTNDAARDGQFVLNQLKQSYQYNGNSFFNFVLVSSETLVSNSHFFVEDLNSEVTTMQNEYGHDEYYTIMFVKKLGDGSVNGLSQLYVSPQHEKQLILFAYDNIKTSNGFLTTITHEFGHMLGTVHGSNPAGNNSPVTGMSNINTILKKFNVPQDQYCDENFNHYVFPNQAVTTTIQGVSFAGYHWHLYPYSHANRNVIHDNGGRSYFMTRLWDCYYIKKFLPE